MNAFATFLEYAAEETHLVSKGSSVMFLPVASAICLLSFYKGANRMLWVFKQFIYFSQFFLTAVILTGLDGVIPLFVSREMENINTVDSSLE